MTLTEKQRAILERLKFVAIDSLPDSNIGDLKLLRGAGLIAHDWIWCGYSITPAGIAALEAK